MTQYTCQTCGGSLMPSGGVWICNYCKNSYVDESVQRESEALRSLLDEYKLEHVANLRRNLYDAINAKYTDSEEICRLCRAIKDILPDDFMARFYYTANRGTPKDIRAAIRSIDEKEHAPYIDGIVAHIIKSMRTEYALPLQNLVERAYKNTDMQKFEALSTAISDEMEKVNGGIYETSVPRDVFVAYSSKDMIKVEELVEFLEENSLDCFVAARNLRHGRGAVQNYEQALREAMNNCKWIVFVSSVNSRSMECDALKVELKHVKNYDIQNAPPEYRQDYTSIPAKYKKKRVEYRLDNEKTQFIAEKVLGEFFSGLEYALSPEEVVNRIYSFNNADAASAPAPAASEKFCAFCGASVSADAKFCFECGKNEFVSTRTEYDLTKKLRELEIRSKDETYGLDAVQIRLLADDYYNGSNQKKQDYQRALELYKKAAEMGDVPAMTSAGYCYEYAHGTEQNWNLAAKYFTAAAEKDDTAGICALGYCYNFGNGVEKNIAKGIELYTIAANRGFAKAQNNLATCYYRGEGVEKNLNKAAELYRLAAAQNYPTAFSGLGVCYILGNGVEKDLKKAFELFTKACELDHADGTFHLGICYEKGYGTAIDIDKAAEAYKKAAARGHERAKLALEALKNAEKERAAKKTESAPQTASPTVSAPAKVGALQAETKKNSPSAVNSNVNTRNDSSSKTATREDPSLSDKAKQSIKNLIKTVGGSSDPTELYKTGLDYIYGRNGKTVDYKQAEQHLSFARMVGNKDADFFIGWIDENGLCGIKDMNAAKICYQRAYENSAAYKNQAAEALARIKVAEEEQAKKDRERKAVEYAQKASLSLPYLDFKLIYNEYSVSLKKKVQPKSDMVIPETYNGKKVTWIEYSGFENCQTIVNVTLPESIAKIGPSAFKGCRALRSINIPGGVKEIDNSTFEGCLSLRDVALSTGLTAIKSNVFMRCHALASINIPESVKEIGCSAFEECVSLKSVIIPKGVTTIAGSTFKNCNTLTSVSIPEGVTVIDSFAFSRCPRLSQVNIPSSVTAIKSYAFRNTGIKSVSLPNTLTSIECSAFADSQLESVILPEGITSIEQSTFNWCRELSSVVLPSTLVSINENAFFGCCKLRSITIPEGVRTIGAGAFGQCTDLISFHIPSMVSSIGQGVLSCYAGNITVDDKNQYFHSTGTELYGESKNELLWVSSKRQGALVIPHGIENISDTTIWSRNTLTSVTVPNTVKKISLQSSFELTKTHDMKIIFTGSKKEWKRIDGAKALSEKFDVEFTEKSGIFK